MDADQLFLHTLRELVDRTKVGAGEYDVLMSALPLRKLLLDPPMIHQINRLRHERVVFRIADNGAYEAAVIEDQPIFWAAYEAISPRLGPHGTSKEVDLKQLLATRVMRASDVDVTVRDVISQVANVEGAVHLGEPKDEKQRLLHEVNVQFRVGGLDGVTRTLLGIAEVVGDGLVPLTRRVLEDRGIKLPDALRHTE
jgi:hypothetical protein